MPVLKHTAVGSLSTGPKNLHNSRSRSIIVSAGRQHCLTTPYCVHKILTSSIIPEYGLILQGKLGFRRKQCFSSSEHRQIESPQSQFLTLPTILTIGRVAAVPLLVSTFYMNSAWGTNAATSIFIAASITDWLDGYIARKMNLGSAFGAFLDPVADKLMVAASLVLLCTRPPETDMFVRFSWLLTVPSIAIIGREITMSAVREWAASQSSDLSEAVAVNNLGKWKTATQMTSLTILLASRNTSLTGSGIVVAFGVALLYISAWLAVWSLYVYMKKIWNVLAA